MPLPIADTGFRSKLRSGMPVVAIAAAVLCLIRIAFLSDDFVARNPLGILVQGLTVATVLLTLLYYGPKAIRWLWRKLLWRLRRRLVITYLFVGLTPVVLLTALGILAGFVASAEAMAKVIRQELQSMQELAASAATGLARELPGVLESGGPDSLKPWLEERAALLRGTLPGARIAVWPGGDGITPYFASVDEGETLPLGPDDSSPGAPLPVWLAGSATFQGLTFVSPPEDSNTRFAVASIRALARGSVAGRATAVLVAVPMSRSLVAHLRSATQIEIHPFFFRSSIHREGTEIHVGGPQPQRGKPIARINMGADFDSGAETMLDQVGEPLPTLQYPVFTSAVDWESGTPSDRVAFVFSWSWSEAARQMLGGNAVAGRIWKIAFLAIGALFLGLELMALLAAILITREVTGTVHELHLATEAVRRGDFSYRARKRSHDQLGELADAYNDMSEHIETLLDERVKHERLRREIEIAADVQSKLFPRSVPQIEGTEMTGECRAARGVAGDYYDYVEVAPGLVVIALADVSGKGISASLLMSNLQASFRAQAGFLKDGPSDGASVAEGVVPHGAAGGPAANGSVARLVASLNAQLCRSTDTNRYATLFLGLYDAKARVLRYTNAGHNAAVLVQMDGTVKKLSLGGTIVGAFDEAVYVESLAGLAPGAVLVIFSDGISEAMNRGEVEFGEDRIASFAVANRHLPAEEMRRRLFDEVDRWSDGVERNDDQTLVILKALGAGG